MVGTAHVRILVSTCRRLIPALAGFALMLGASAAPAATYTITADRDSYLRESPSHSNQGTVTELDATNASKSRHPILGFTMPAIPANEVITSATIRLYVTNAYGSGTINLHRVTDTWAENTVSWGSTAGAFAATPSSSVTGFTAGGVYVSFDATSLANGWRAGTFANNGVMLIGGSGINVLFASREYATATRHPQLIITTLAYPELTVVKSRSLVSDPFSSSNPKNIPGAVANYTITVANSASGSADNNSTVVIDAVPAGLELYVGDLGGAGSGPILFTNGSPSSGLSYSYTSLGAIGDNISFSNDGGVNFNYTPVPGSGSYDPAVTHFRVNLSGTFAPGSGASSPSFNLVARMRVK